MNRVKVVGVGIAAATLAFLGNGAVSSWVQVAQASGTTLQTVSQTETLVNDHCFKTHKVTTTYYHWSKTHYVPYVAPKRTVTDSTTCHS